MPTNVTVGYTMAEQEYNKSKTLDEKISALQKMLSTAPTHKGAQKLRQEIKTKLAKLKEKKKKELEKKAKGKQISIKKEGAATICLIGPSNSGKSLLLNKLTNSKAKVADYEFTTKKPEIGIMKYKGLKIQIVEIPSIFEGYSESEKGPQFLSIVRQADLVIVVTDTPNLEILFKELDKANIALNESIVDKDESWIRLNGIIVINKKDIIDIEKIHQELCKYYNFDRLKISALDKENIENLKDEIWKHLDLIKVYTKEPGKRVKKLPNEGEEGFRSEASKPFRKSKAFSKSLEKSKIFQKDEPVCLKKGAIIEDMAVHIHKDFINKFRFARVWGKSAKFDGMQSGLKHKLEDDDIVELHLK